MFSTQQWKQLRFATLLSAIAQKERKEKKTRRRAKEQKSDRQNRRREQFPVAPNQCRWKDVPLKKIQWLHAYLTFIMTSKLSEKLQKLKGMSHFHNWISNLSRNIHGPPTVYLSKILLSHVICICAGISFWTGDNFLWNGNKSNSFILNASHLLKLSFLLFVKLISHWRMWWNIRILYVHHT